MISKNCALLKISSQSLYPIFLPAASRRLHQWAGWAAEGLWGHMVGQRSSNGGPASRCAWPRATFLPKNTGAHDPGVNDGVAPGGGDPAPRYSRPRPMTVICRGLPRNQRSTQDTTVIMGSSCDTTVNISTCLHYKDYKTLLRFRTSYHQTVRFTHMMWKSHQGFLIHVIFINTGMVEIKHELWSWKTKPANRLDVCALRMTPFLFYYPIKGIPLQKHCQFVRSTLFCCHNKILF